MTGSVRPCTDPKSDAKKAKADEAGAMVPEATVTRRQKKKEKTFEVLILDESTTTWTARVSVPWSSPSQTTGVAC